MVKHTVRKENLGVAKVEQGLDFYLGTTEDGEVELRAEDHHGHKWRVLKIAGNGKLSLAAGLGLGLGVEIGTDGTLEINEDAY